VRRHRAGKLVSGQKAGGELVTAADLEADAVLRSGLAAAYPADGLLSEETPPEPGAATSGRLWIIDPIDGTSDYAAGGDEHAISIGLAVKGAPVLGVVYNPARDEMVSGSQGSGVRLQGAPAAASALADPAQARVTISRTEWERELEQRRLPMPAPLIPLSSVAYKLARVAAGLDDATFSIHARRAWDVCAGVALVLAGGGRVTYLDGSAVHFDRPEARMAQGLIASGAALHGPLSAVLAKVGIAPREQPLRGQV
jgi:myo-inositol-1(or 4)-monophosphatase